MCRGEEEGTREDKKEEKKGRKEFSISLPLLLLSSPSTSEDDRNQSSRLDHGLMGRGGPSAEKK
jgi:hypothetical protein